MLPCFRVPLIGAFLAILAAPLADTRADSCLKRALTRPGDSSIWRVIPERELEGRPLLVVSDIHGHLKKLKNFLRSAGFIDDQGGWTGGRAIVVVNGDQINKGPDSYGVVMFVRDLRRQAKKAGGEVISTYGNHEILQLEDLGDATSELTKSIKRAGEDPDEVLSEGSAFARALGEMKMGVVLGDVGFLHSGRIGRSSLRRAQTAIRRGEWSDEALQDEAKSPLFARDWEFVEKDVEKTIANAKDMGLRTLVVSHQPYGFGQGGIVHWRYKSEGFNILKIDSGMYENPGRVVFCRNAASFSRKGPSACFEMGQMGQKRRITPLD